MRQTILCCVLTILLAQGRASKRNLTEPDINPGSKDREEPVVVHVAARGPSDTIHHVWGLRGAPTFITALTPPSAVLTVDWDKLDKGEESALQFSTKPNATFGLAIPHIILYNDMNDKGKLLPEDDRIPVPMSEFEWRVKQKFFEGGRESGAIFESVSFRGELLPNETRIVIQIAAYGVDGRSTVLPHLLRTPDSSQFDIVLDHLILNDLNSSHHLGYSKKADHTPMSGFKNPRWAMDVVIFSSEVTDEGKAIQLSKQKSLDDENTPGVFHLDEITTPLSREGKGGAYMQWRPVSYLTPGRDIGDSTFPNIDESLAPLTNISYPMNISLAYALLGGDLLNGLTASTAISFGQSKDKFYTGSNYTTWTVAVGLGSPPVETFSTLVIVVISLGIGIPTLMFLVGGVVLVVRKYRRSQDELLLN